MNKRHSSPKKFNIKSYFKNAKPLDYIIMGAILLLVAAIVTIVIIMVSKSAKPVSTSSLPGSDTSVSADNVNAAADKSYDKDAEKINKKDYSGTVLEETDDAGREYIKETLFIGDSNTVRSMSYGQTTLDNNVAAVSMGIQHVCTKPIVYFKGMDGAVTVPKAVEIIQPKRIVITYGTNNTIGWSTDTFITEYEKALDAIVSAYPYADIIINAIPPIDRQRENTGITMQTIDSFNSALAKLAKSKSYKFLDSAEALKDEKTGYAKTNYTISDGIHLNKDGNEAWFKYVRTHSYITEDRRPMPLNTVPGRKETPPGIITEDPLAIRGQAKGVKISFGSTEGGSLEGTLSQTVKSGDVCSNVKAVPAAGHVFIGWTCSAGSISDVRSTSLAFTVPSGVTDGEISIVANFGKLSLSIVDASGNALPAISLKVGETYALSAVFSPGSYSGNKVVSFSSDLPDIASVSGGTITAKSAGVANITVKSEDGSLTASVNVTVTAPPPVSSSKPIPPPVSSSVPLPPPTVALSDFSLNHTEATLDVGGNVQLAIASKTPAEATVKAVVWASGNPSVATVDTNGNVVAVGGGTAVIACTIDNIQHSCVITVNAPPAPPPPPPPPPEPPVSSDPPPVVSSDPTVVPTP